MTPERMGELVARWVRFYTRDLPASVAQRRIDEIDADLTTTSRTNGPTESAIVGLRAASRPGWSVASPPTLRGVDARRRSPPVPRPGRRR